MKSVFDFVFKNEGLPRWIVFLNYASLLGIVAWPFVVFGSIFMFDHPKNFNNTALLVLLVDCYPLYLLVLTYFSFRLFRFSKLVSALLPLIPLTGYIYITFQYLLPGIG